MSNFTHRVCPATGLRIHRAAENLIKANAVTAIVFLAVGGFFGLLVALTRWPGVHLLPAEWFYLVLTGHGLDVLLVWIIFFEIAVLYFASAILLNSRLAAPRWAWTGFALMLIGAVITNVAVLQGNSSVMFTSYVPMQAAPHFYLGLILFAVGALSGWIIDLADTSEPAMRLAAGSLCLLSAGIDLARRPATDEPALDGFGAALMPVALPLFVRPAMLLAGFSVVADRGMSLYALALIIAVVMLTALSAIPVGPDPERPMLVWIGRLLSVIAVAGAVLLIADAVFDI